MTAPDIRGHSIHIGLDPASRRDYFGIAVHVLIPNDDVPHLIHLNQYRNERYTTILTMLHEKDLLPFRNFTNMVVDATGNIAICEALQDRYGENRVIEHIFTAGEHGTRMHIIEDSIHYMNGEGDLKYELPQVDPSTTFGQMVEILRSQIRKESFVPTPTGILRADHPRGGKNDLLNAWQLSLKGARIKQFRNMSVSVPKQMLEETSMGIGNARPIPRIGHGSRPVDQYNIRGGGL